ncbi:DUF5361 domain-containing protein [Microbacterium sp. NPDC087592]|uniref:DUF5361 domain-containing protein n=1 Tax=Microbacterium sp. NPDC087592 TaxID=3364193 RepID=UPI00382D6727
MIRLLALWQESPEAVEYDLIRHGERWRNVGHSLSWRDVKVILEMQQPSDSALWMEQNPDHMWGLPEFLLAEVVDSLHMLWWSKTKDGHKNRNRPKPLERPGRRPERMGKKPLPLDEMAVWLAERVPVSA